ncbi:MAG: rod shape-determining protein RodA, partial [Acidobacteria bacterium]|nr:rod shape-determining protein RodA [Acidobacteriota bacterium]
AILGIVQIYSATEGTKFAGAHLRQIYWVLLGLGLAFFVSLYDYRRLLNYAPWFYLAVLILLAVTLVMGAEISGARRWLRVGGINFQVSEIAKLSIILLLARFFGGPQEGNLSWPDLGKVAVVVGLPVALIAWQPDLGTALTLVPVVLVMLFVAGLRLRYFAFLLLAGIVSLPIAWHYLKPYQKERIATFLEPDQDPQKSGYQVSQSKIAVGSGQLWGKGTAQGTQTQLRFLPVPHTDFIFASYAEEHGFFGVLLGLLLYFVGAMRLVQNAQRAPDAAGMFLVAGIAGVFLFQVFVNIGMVVGYLPVTGIPLPLMSYGGSSAVFAFLAMGLVNSVRVRRFVN